MPRIREHSEPTRKLYADIREDIYLAAKSRAAELRVPMRRFVEDALTNAISGDSTQLSRSSDATAAPIEPSVWDDQYLRAQANQPLGAPIGLSDDEARRVALGAFDFSNSIDAPMHDSDSRQPEFQALGRVGDPVDFSDEDAAHLARTALMFGAPDDGEADSG
ncbi:MAG: hypothetical protein OXG80_03800 [Chloroflexi bacterium]|nr:hypothetical protein [Chloroflexota bacterium]